MLLDHVHPSFCFLTTAPNKGFTCPIQGLLPLLLLLQLLQAMLEWVCLFQYLLFLWFYLFPWQMQFQWIDTEEPPKTDVCSEVSCAVIQSRENREATENSLTTGETSLPGRNPEPGWSGTGLPHLSSGLETPSPHAFVEMQHPQRFI